MNSMNKDEQNIEGLNSRQSAAASYQGRNLLVLAGAGTGKTRTIIARARYLLEHGVAPSRLLILSFTRKSAKEIVTRLQSSTVKDARQLSGLTFHSWCMQLIERNPGVFNFGHFTVIDEEDRESAFKLVCGRHFKKANFIDPKQLAEVYSYAVNARCKLSTALGMRLFYGHVDEQTRNKIIEKLPVYQEVIKKYIAFKNERRYLDYDDILNKVALALHRHPEAAEYIAGGYDHILVDEMQDTNPLQYLLLSSFWRHCNVFCVGDDAQSIYGFRGADFNSIHYFKEVVPDAEVMKLTVNYRSTQEILDLSNWVLEGSPLNYDKHLTADRGHGDKPLIVHFREEWDQARDIVMRIKDSLGEAGCKYKDNMVLSRSNWGLKSVEACLIEAKIPYELYGGTSLMASAHVRDLVSALRVATNPRDELAWQRYLCLFPRIGEITAAKIIDALLDKESLEECVEVLRSNKTLDSAAAETLTAISELQSEVSRAVQAALKGLSNVLRYKYKDDWDRRSRDLPLLQKIAEAADSLVGFISDYILDPSLSTGVKNEGDPEDCVILTTIHSAKGLEARNCYLVNANYSQYPSVKAITAGDAAIEEDRRCLYVALTRAKDSLVIYRSHKAAQVVDYPDPSGPAGLFSKLISPELRKTIASLSPSRLYFLNDIPANLYTPAEISDPKHRWDTYTGQSIALDGLDDFDFS